MNYRKIDLATYPRREHFENFLTMQDPFVTINVHVDITQWQERKKAVKAPFFLSFLYAVSNAANDVPEFRRRIRDGGIVEYDHCDASYVVMSKGDVYRYCNVRTDLPFEDYLREAIKEQRAAEQGKGLTESDDPEQYIFYSSVPKLTYASLVLPKPYPHFSVPGFTWGKCFEDNGKLKIPVTLQINHALMDGFHVNHFFENLEAELNEMFVGTSHE